MDLFEDDDGHKLIQFLNYQRRVKTKIRSPKSFFTVLVVRYID